MDKELIKEIEDSMETVYAFVMSSYDDYSKPRDYGNGEKMPMVEIHTLSLIADNPGIVVTDVAKMWNRTLSAASQNVNKLARKGLVKKVKEPGNNKAIHLYATDEGRQLSQKHREYDDAQLSKLAAIFMENHSMDELRAALDVIATGLEYYSSSQESEELC